MKPSRIRLLPNMVSALQTTLFLETQHSAKMLSASLPLPLHAGRRGLNLSAIQRHGRSLAAGHTPCAKHYIIRLNSRNTIQKIFKQALRLARCFRRPGGTGKPSASVTGHSRGLNLLSPEAFDEAPVMAM